MKYTANIEFETTRELTQDELNFLIGSIELQIQEPQDDNCEDLDWSARHYSVKVEKVSE